ncbi:MAG: hypothetical protein U0736_12585 [Gemmataceae bacterium]
MMTADGWLRLSMVVVEQGIYLTALSFLAWVGERRRDVDAFHLVAAYTAGVAIAWLLKTWDSIPDTFSLFAGAVAATTIDGLWPTSGDSAGERPLVQVIVVASLSLLSLDWLTAHAPVSVSHPGSAPVHLALAGMAAVLAYIGRIQATAAFTRLRLGRHNAWALEYWAHPTSAMPRGLMPCSLICWYAVVTLPAATTGILSSTILKNVAIAVLIARLAETRGLGVLAGAATTLAALRTVAGYAFVSQAGPPVVEAAVFCCLLLWLRHRGTRTAWREYRER